MYRILSTILSTAVATSTPASAALIAVNDSSTVMSDSIIATVPQQSIAASELSNDSIASSLAVDSLRLTLIDDTKDIKKEIPSIYDLPYSVSTSCPHWKNLWVNTGVLFGAGFATLGVLELLPESATAWNKAEIHKKPIFERWWTNVKKGPVWDHDNAVFNYILHPYGGAAYYMSARSQGFNMFQSFAYAAAVSTIFWEYGIEAFMEVPSVQDLFITPIGGMLVGETFYRVKRYIVEHDYRLLGSPVLGHIAAFLVDPVNEVIDLVRGNPNTHYSSRHNSQLAGVQITVQPWMGGGWGGYPGAKAGFSIQCVF